MLKKIGMECLLNVHGIYFLLIHCFACFEVLQPTTARILVKFDDYLVTTSY